MAHGVLTVRKRLVVATVLAWAASIGIDLLIHGGLLASLYMEPSPFLLPADSMFRRIPLGYSSFLILAAFLVWLMDRLSITTAMAGLRFGLTVGSVIWCAFVLGLWSVSTISPALAVGWFVGQSLELGAAGAVAATSLRADSQKRLVVAVCLLVLACAVVTIALQSTGLAPAQKAP